MAESGFCKGKMTLFVNSHLLSSVGGSYDSLVVLICAGITF